MNKHKETNCHARKALFADGSRFLPLGALAVIAGFLCFAPAFAEARFLFFGKDKSPREIKADQAVKKLKGSNSAERGRAADELMQMDKKRGVSEIKTALKKEKDDQAKKNMLNALGNSGDAEAIPDVKEHLSSGDRGVRLYAACALAALGDDSGLGELETVITDAGESRGRRSFAIRSLGGIKTDAAVAVLENVLKDGDFAIRLQAVSSLGKIGTSRALNTVKGMAGDKDERVRDAAGNILMRTEK
ncbi:MAG: hypothetical protein CVU78_06310 [Elusimicrobia bacterium HGW-Elusimicrobia-2]|nr:MAG: hypothetical protein CVU78_06310 [Elusimicrobia bacterium HGW-Elusimicrobia-2]